MPTQEEINNLYTQVLGRAPKPEAMEFWSNYSGDNFQAAFNAEAQKELANKPTASTSTTLNTSTAPKLQPPSTSDVKSLYTSTFGADRTPSSDALDYWTNYSGGNFEDAFKAAAQPELKENKLNDLYGGLLYRDPNQEALDWWKNSEYALDGSLTNAFTAAAQPEIDRRNTAISGLYSDLYGTNPTQQQSDALFQTGLSGNQLTNYFDKLPETMKYKTLLGDVTGAYQSIFGKAPSQQEAQYWANSGLTGDALIQAMQTQQSGSTGLLSGQYPTDPAAAGTLQNEVTSYYQSILGRDPTPSDLQYWMSQGLTGAALQQAIYNGANSEITGNMGQQQANQQFNDAADAQLAKLDAQYQTLTQQLQNAATTEEAELLSNRLAAVMDEAGPLMQRAGTISNQLANQRGILNSTIATGAGTAAMTDQALKIASGDVDVDKFNVEQANAMQRGLLGEYGSTGRAAMGNTANLLGSSLDSQNKYVLADQANALDMERDMLNYTNTRAIEMLKQQSGLYAQYLSAYSGIAASDIPASQKDAQLANLAANIDAAVNAANRYADLNITNAPGGFSFDPVNESGVAATQQTSSGASSDVSLIQQDWDGINSKVNEIYEQVRVGGGDSPEETLIDGWRTTMQKIQSQPYAFSDVMGIYREAGLSADNWEDTLRAMIEKAKPYIAQIEEAEAASGYNLDSTVD